MKPSLALLILMVPFSAKSQTGALDSLQRELKQAKSQEKKADILNQLSFACYTLSVEKAEEYAAQALEVAQFSNYTRGIAEGYNNMGICNSVRGTYDKGLDFFIKALKIKETMGDNDGAAKILNNIAGIYLYQKDFDKALTYSQKSLKLVRKQKDRLAIGNAYVTMGMIYQSKEDTILARLSFFNALNEFEELNDRRKQGEVLVKISSLLEENKKYDGALKACFQAMDVLNVQVDFLIAIDLFQTIGQIYSDVGNEKTALLYFHRALTLADQSHDQQGRMDCCRKLSKLFEKSHHYDSALRYYQAYADLSEKTYTRERASQLAKLEKVFETEQKDQLLELNRNRIQLQEWIIAAVSVVLLLSTVFGAMVYKYYRQNKKANIQLSELNKVVSERNEEITVQSEELIDANEEIKRINENLEEEVNHRTERIQAQNEKLLDYAYFNAHKVRGPLARILGLAMLIEAELSQEEIKNLNQRIRASALELDNVIKEINKKLETE